MEGNMKQKIIIKAKDSDKTTLEVSAVIDVSIYTLTKDEQIRFKRKVQELLFNSVREAGFMLHEIKLR